MSTETNGHIFTGGEQRMRDTAQEQLAGAANLLNEPLKVHDVREALRSARAAVAALTYLEGRANGQPPPKRGE